MHNRAAGIVVEQMLAPCAGTLQYPTVDSGCRRCEPTLRTRDRHWRTGISALVQPSQSMQGMPFGHAWS